VHTTCAMKKEMNSFHWKMFLVYKGLPVDPLCYFYP